MVWHFCTATWKKKCMRSKNRKYEWQTNYILVIASDSFTNYFLLFWRLFLLYIHQQCVGRLKFSWVRFQKASEDEFAVRTWLMCQLYPARQISGLQWDSNLGEVGSELESNTGDAWAGVSSLSSGRQYLNKVTRKIPPRTCTYFWNACFRKRVF